MSSELKACNPGMEALVWAVLDQLDEEKDALECDLEDESARELEDWED